MKYLLPFFFLFFLSGCALKKPLSAQSATVLIKTPAMKFYDKGFITHFSDYTQVQIYSTGQKVLDLTLYDNQVCQSTFECMSAKDFNKAYFHKSYAGNFLKELLEKSEKEVVFRDKKNGILIKIKKD